MHTKQMSINESKKIIGRPVKPKLDDLYIITSPLDIKDKIVIDIKDILNFAFCPLYYKFRGKDTNVISLVDLYDKSMHNTIYAYLRSFQEGTLENTIEFLKYRWGQEWIKYKKTRDLIVTSPNPRWDTYDKYRKIGINGIFKFDNMIEKDKQLPIIIGHKYRIEIIPNVILTGTLECIREVTYDKESGDSDKVIQLIRFLTHVNRFDTIMAKTYDLELIAASYAFKELFNVDYFQSVSMEIETEKIIINNYSDKEYNLLKETVKNVIICLQNNINMIAPGKCCYHCSYRKTCIKTI